MTPKSDAKPLRRLLSLPRDPVRLAAARRMLELKSPEARAKAEAALEKLCAPARRTDGRRAPN